MSHDITAGSDAANAQGALQVTPALVCEGVRTFKAHVKFTPGTQRRYSGLVEPDEDDTSRQRTPVAPSISKFEFERN